MFILTTIPILFGAIHPIVQSGYVCIILLGLGSWLLYGRWATMGGMVSRRGLVPIVLLLAWAGLQSLPLPMAVVEWLSPVRAERVQMVNLLAGSTDHFVPLSDQGVASLQYVILFLALLLYFLALRLLFRRHPSFMHTIAMVFVVVGLFEALYGLFQFLRPQLGILWLPIAAREAHGTIIYKNQYAALLNMCWPVAIALTVPAVQKILRGDGAKPWRQRLVALVDKLSRENKLVVFHFFAAGLMLLAVLFSLSRGGIITMLVVLFSLNITLPLSRKTKVLMCGSMLILLAGYGTLLGFDTVLDRFNTIDQSGLGRINLYLSSLPMLKDHWLIGIGLGSYDLLSPVYLPNFPANVHFDHVHNEYLEFALELGLPASLLLFGWLGSMLARAGKQLMLAWGDDTRDEAQLILGTAALCGLLGFFLHGWADFGWRLPANLVYAATLGAFLATALAAPHAAQENATAMIEAR